MDDQVNKILDVLAAHFGTTVAHLWEIIVRQQEISGWTNIVGGVLAIGFSITCFLVSRLCVQSARKKDYKDADGELVGLCFTVILGVIGGIIAMSSIPTGIQHVLNPEYFALADILSRFK